MEEDIQKTYQLPGGKERYWDQFSLEYFKENYQVAVRSCTFEDVIEVDTYADIKKLDPLYK